MDYNKPEVQHVLSNNIKILKILSEAIILAENSTQVLDRAFGISQGGSPRIGNE